jgi:hypothetical protein
MLSSAGDGRRRGRRRARRARRGGDPVHDANAAMSLGWARPLKRPWVDTALSTAAAQPSNSQALVRKSRASSCEQPPPPSPRRASLYQQRIARLRGGRGPELEELATVAAGVPGVPFSDRTPVTENAVASDLADPPAGVHLDARDLGFVRTTLALRAQHGPAPSCLRRYQLEPRSYAHCASPLLGASAVRVSDKRRLPRYLGVGNRASR